MALPVEVVQTDNHLEQAQSRSLKELARHRWHWTLDESNPDRVSIREYARQVSRGFTTVHAMVEGFRISLDRGTPINEAMARAQVGAEKEAVIEAVAEAEGVAFDTARKRYDDVREVRTMAQERAERKGTSLDEEVIRVAKERVKAKDAVKRLKADRASRHSFRYIAIEGHIAAAIRRLTEALREAEDVAWDSEEVELLTDSLGRLRALIGLIDLRITGDTTVDWDTELANLMEDK